MFFYSLQTMVFHIESFERDPTRQELDIAVDTLHKVAVEGSIFPECVARVPVSLGGPGVRLCSPSFAFAVATVRNRLRDRRKALHSGECVWSGPESVSSGLFVAAIILVSAEEVSVWVICVAALILVSAEQVSLRVICVVAVILVFAEEVSVWVICDAAVILVSAEEVSVWVICVAAVISVSESRCLWEWSVSSQLYWRLQRRCLCEWSVSPQFYWCLQRRCLCDISVSPQFYRCLQRRCLCEWSVSQQRVKSECHTRVSCKKCHVWVCYKRVE